MTDVEKLEITRTLLNSTDTRIGTYLDLARAEIMSWLGVDEFPSRYDVTQVMAVVAGYSMEGAEGQTSHSENGISRSWKHEDMVAYIRSHVHPQVVVI